MDHSASELRSLARSETGPVACRILAIAHVLDSASRAEAASVCGMDRQTLRDWVHRFNAAGLEGLANKTSPGRSPALSDEQMAELKQIVLAGPDLAKDGVVRWRCCDLQGVIAERFGVDVHERTIGKLLRRLGLTRLRHAARSRGLAKRRPAGLQHGAHADCEDEDAKRPHREREHLVQEKLRVENRIEALLFTQGIRGRPSLRSWERDMAELRTGGGRALPPLLHAELDRLRLCRDRDATGRH